MLKIKKVVLFVFCLAFGSVVLMGCSPKKQTPTAEIKRAIILRTTIELEVEVHDPAKAIAGEKVQARLYEKGEEVAKSTKNLDSKDKAQTIKFTSLEAEKEYKIVLYATYHKKSQILLSKEYQTSTLGSSENPHKITNKDQLLAMKDDPEGHFILENDIDMLEYVSDENLSETQKRTVDPIFSSSNGFKGVLDGNGKTLSNILVSRNVQYMGLFGYISEKGIIKNLSLVDLEMKLSRSSEAFVGGVVGYNAGTIDNVSIVNLNLDFEAKGTSALNVGGFVGYNALSGAITNSSVAGQMKVIGTTIARIGGFVGRNYSENSSKTPKIESCFTDIKFTGGIDSKDASLKDHTVSLSLGGLIGENEGRLKDSYSKFAIVSKADAVATDMKEFRAQIGGLVGLNTDSARIENSIAFGGISLDSKQAQKVKIGGIVGWNTNLGRLKNVVYLQGAEDLITVSIGEETYTDHISFTVGLNNSRISEEIYTVEGVEYKINEEELVQATVGPSTPNVLPKENLKTRLLALDFLEKILDALL